MTKQEFLEAVDAYLDGTANSWQQFILDDNYNSFEYELDILELLRDSEVEEINDRILTSIKKNVHY